MIFLKIWFGHCLAPRFLGKMVSKRDKQGLYVGTPPPEDIEEPR